jgi:hypothetical protein
MSLNYKLMTLYKTETGEDVVYQLEGLTWHTLKYVLWLENRAAKTLETQPETAGRTLEGVAPTTEQRGEIIPSRETCANRCFNCIDYIKNCKPECYKSK